jgi:formylmethanofuran dehydrogenase subunit E
MFICLECNEVFEEPKVVYEHHPYGMTYATEEWRVCPHCGDSNIDIAVECSRCGEYIAKEEAYTEGKKYLCDFCYEELYE